MLNIIQILIQSNTVNFLIVLFIVLFLIKKLNVGQKVENLRDEITNYVEVSEKEKTQSEHELSKINDKIAKLPALIERLKRSTERNVKNIEENVYADIEERKQDISKNAQRLFNLETKKFKTGLSNLLSEKSVEIARENAINQLKENPDLHNKYIDTAIEELDGLTL